MGSLDWMKGHGKGAEKEPKVFLSHGDRWALRRMIQHFDDGLLGNQGGEWRKTFDKMAERLTLRFRDPFGDRSVSVSAKEAEALSAFQNMYERHAADGKCPGTVGCGRYQGCVGPQWRAQGAGG